MDVDYSKLKEYIIADLSIELQMEPTFSREILAVKVENAIREVMAIRNYDTAGKDADWVTEDLEKYYAIIRNVALYDFAQLGAPFETSHSENSVNRTWINRNSLFAGVRAIAVIF